MNRPKSLIQRVVFWLGVGSYFGGAACLAYAHMAEGLSQSAYASFLASTVFFVGVGVVLNVIGAANLPSLRLEGPER